MARFWSSGRHIEVATLGAKLAGIFSHPAPYPASSWMKKIQLDARRAGHPAGAGGSKIANPGALPATSDTVDIHSFSFHLPIIIIPARPLIIADAILLIVIVGPIIMSSPFHQR
jgi:hypothetical protein